MNFFFKQLIGHLIFQNTCLIIWNNLCKFLLSIIGLVIRNKFTILWKLIIYYISKSTSWSHIILITICSFLVITFYRKLSGLFNNVHFFIETFIINFTFIFAWNLIVVKFLLFFHPLLLIFLQNSLLFLFILNFYSLRLKISQAWISLFI